MKKHIISLFAVMGAFLAVTSCSDDKLPVEGSVSSLVFTPKGELVDAYLNLSVSGLFVTTAARDATDDEDTPEERTVNDLWVFQYDANGKDEASQQLIAVPQYLTISDQEELTNVPVKLSNNDGDKSIIYVVTNTGNSAWATYSSDSKNYNGFMSISDIKNAAIPTPRPQRMIYDYDTNNGTYIPYEEDGDLSIPMSGFKDEVTITEGTRVTVDVQRMFAKLCIRVDLSKFDRGEEYYKGAEVSDVTVGNIPEYCRVTTLADPNNEAQAGDYSGCSWITRAFTENEPESESTDIYPYVIYVPENIQGTNGEADKDKSENIPKTTGGSDAYVLSVTANINVTTLDDVTLKGYPFTAYPGGYVKEDKTDANTNFNVKRNCIYYLTLTIYNLEDYDLMQPSANCIICLSGETTAFYPYYRPEEGGGYEFIDYLNYKYSNGEPEVKSKRIDHVGIIWQSEKSAGGGGYIGDNTGGNLVKVDAAPESGDDDDMTQAEYKRKIYVTIPSGEVGNALVAAYNSDNEIIWSWHIWSRSKDDDPGNEGNGVLYYTYSWDNKGIKSDSARVAGYTVMNCNLGALANTPPSYTTFSSAPFGTLYQWGRKDPFPASKTVNSSPTNYSQSIVGNYYDNSGTTLVGMTEKTTDSYLFHSVAGTGRESSIGEKFDDYIVYSVNNPTVFICGTKEAGKLTENYASSLDNYVNPQDGNWLLDSKDDHFNRLWGGLDPEHDNISKSYDTGLTDKQSNSVHMYDDYGTEKSIFDPCPYGWRVSPPDLWLGFTSTGLNPSDMKEVNYSSYDSTNHGFYMYMDGWKDETKPGAKATATSYFPCQGTRIADGCSYRVGSCGNYHNATADANDRVNILHLHNDYTLFHIFEVTYLQYYVKSVAGPVRCVRYGSVTK